MMGPCWRDPIVGCGCRDAVDRANCGVPFMQDWEIRRAKEESMYDGNKKDDAVAAARLVFTVADDGTVRKVKDSYNVVDFDAEYDVHAMVEEIANLRLAHLGIDARYVDGEYVEGGFNDQDVACPADCEGCAVAEEARNGDSSVELPGFDLIIVDRTPGATTARKGYETREEFDEFVAEMAQPLDDPDTYGDTGVEKELDPYTDAAHDLERRGIDATANVDLVEAWAHALEVADATD